jgi:two-component system, NarL family, nitrate/nitrite response regulator NarL
MLALAVQPIRILLVDDHRSVLWGLEKLIDSARPSMQVIGKAAHCAEALAAVDKYQPDVVLLDVALEKENGLDLLRALRGRRAPKVLILTGVRDPEVCERAMLWGARGVMYKLESAEMILKAIAHVHTGELWLDRATMAKVFASTLSAGNDGEGTGPASGDAALTATERRIIAAVVRHKGAPRKVIADALHTSSHTLRNHLASIYSKLGVHTRLDLFLYAKEHGLDKHTA